MSISAFCPICCEKYNKTLKTKVVCGIGTCNYSACKQCVRTYLTTTTQDPHCMKCKKPSYTQPTVASEYGVPVLGT